MNQPKVYLCPPILEPSSHLLPYPTPLGCHRAPALGSLAVYFAYGNVYVSMLLYQFAPPSPSPLCPQVCFLCLCLLCCPADEFIRTILLDPHICISIQYLFFSFWLASLYAIGSRFIYLIRTDSNVFLLYGWVIFHVYTHYNFFIHSSADGHLGCFHVLAMVNTRFSDFTDSGFPRGYISQPTPVFLFLLLRKPPTASLSLRPEHWM